jgi:predicted  nucleic acid-binding Zn-ribbon protein
VLRRQLDALEKLALEAKTDISALREERASLAASLEAAQKEAKATRRALSEAEAEAGERIRQLAAQNAAILGEVADSRGKVAPALAGGWVV